MPRDEGAPLLRKTVDVLLPALQEATALGRGAILGEVVIDELHLGQLGRLGRQRRRSVGRDLILLGLGADALGIGGEGPIGPAPGVAEGRAGVSLGCQCNAERVPSQGATTFTGNPATASVMPSCMKLMLTPVSPRPTALIGAVPERVY